MPQTKYDPEKWLESTIRAIKDYAAAAFNSNIYTVVMEFPGADMDLKYLPLHKTVVHFEVDDMPETVLGFGENTFRMNYDEPTYTVNPQEAREHFINFDVGIWASDASGGTTSRMRARQILSWLFGGAQAIDALRAASNGGDGSVEIVRFGGGRFAIDSVNDQRVYRMVDGVLEVRVFSRTPLSKATGPAIEQITQQPVIWTQEDSGLILVEGAVMPEQLPAVVNLSLYRGDSWTQDFRLVKGSTPVDLSAATVAAQARDEAGTNYTITTAKGADPGVITLSMAPGYLDAGNYEYDIEVTDAGTVTTWIQGTLAVQRDVTNELP